MLNETDLLTFLEDEYRQSLVDNNPGLDAIVTRELEKAQPFLSFCRKYLDEHRISGIYPVDNNYGLILEGGARVLVSPRGDALFSFSDGNNIDTSGAMPITR